MCDKCSNFRQFEKQIMRNVIYIPCKNVLLHKKLHSWGQKVLLCKHDVCEHKKRLNFCTQYKISTALCDFISKCRSWRIVDTVKDKKEKNIKIKATNTNRKQQQPKKLNIITKLGFEPRSLAWQAKIIATGVLYHMVRLKIYEIFVQISVPRMRDQQ